MSATTWIQTRERQALRLFTLSRERAAFGPAMAAGLGAALGLATAFAMARGPATSEQGLIVILTGLALGLVVGVAYPSRWGTLIALVAYVALFEIGRRGTPGPTVDALRLDNTFGILALLVSRGVHYLLFAIPLIAGGSMGRILARRLAGAPRRAHGPVRAVLGAIPSGIAILLAVGLAVLVALPASTPAVLGSDGKPVPGSIAELATVRLGGVDQSVMIRAADPNKPVLLYLSGGPGQSDMALSRVFAEPFVRDFVFVDWDQRGNGKSYAAIDPVRTFTLDQAVADTIELTDYLRQRFGETKVYLMGESWGTILGVLAVERRPDLYYAWIGSGQMVDIVETDKRVYRDLVSYAQRTGDVALSAKLAEIGEPPYHDIPWANSNLLAWYDYLYKPYTAPESYEARGAAGGLDPFGMLGSEYNLVEKANVLRGLLDTFTLMYPQLYAIDFRRDVTRLEVPVYILDGKAELAGRRDVMLEWFEALQAPAKQRIEFGDAAHSVAFEEADSVRTLLAETIVPATYTR